MHSSTKPGEHGRASSRPKIATVLRLLRGEDLELDSRQLGVTAANLFGWEDDFPPLSPSLGLLDLAQIQGASWRAGRTYGIERESCLTTIWHRNCEV